jgi:hypothetical protein
MPVIHSDELLPEDDPIYDKTFFVFRGPKPIDDEEQEEAPSEDEENGRPQRGR